MTVAANISPHHGLADGTVRAGDAARLLLRITLGVLTLLHGVGKLEGGIAAVVGMVAKTGLPGAVGAGRYSVGGAQGRWN